MGQIRDGLAAVNLHARPSSSITPAVSIVYPTVVGCD